MKTLNDYIRESLLDDEEKLIGRSIKDSQNPFLILKYNYINNGKIAYTGSIDEIKKIFDQYKVMDNIPMNDHLYLAAFRNSLGVEIDGYAECLIEISKNYMKEESKTYKDIKSKCKDFNNESLVITFQEWFGQDNGFIEIMFKTKAKYLKWIREFAKKYQIKKVDDFMYIL
jgi:hypothetical protein